jgi:predicted transcriptional regulator
MPDINTTSIELNDELYRRLQHEATRQEIPIQQIISESFNHWVHFLDTYTPIL